ncbi:MAG: DNA polymerase III subunit delta [Candidatus Peribacteraceae bacterium]
MSQIHLFSGENHYALLEEKKRWMREFRQKHGQENLLVLDSKNLVLNTLLNEVAVAPFISGNRLVVVEGAFKCLKADAVRLEKSLHPQVVLLFVVPIEPGKKGKLPAGMKEIEKRAQCREFRLITPAQRSQWMEEFCTKQNAQLSPEARTALLDTIGDDQSFLAQEITKLALHAQGMAITRQDVQDLTICAGERQVWHLMDLLGAGNAEEAILYAESVLLHGESPHGLWSRLLWMVTQLTLVWVAVQEGITSPPAIMREVGVNFSSVRAILPCARRLDITAMRRIVTTVAEMDRALKTGQYRATGEAPEELLALIDQCILCFAR